MIVGHPRTRARRDAVSVRVGIDVGGTFTDLVAIDPASGVVRSRKVLTTSEAPARGVLAGLQALAPDAGSIAHGTDDRHERDRRGPARPHGPRHDAGLP